MTEAELQRLYAAHGYSVFRRCAAYLGERAAAEGALEEVFVRAVRGGGDAGERDARGWLCGLADELCLERLRARDRRPRRARAPESSVSDEALYAALSATDRETLPAVHRLIADFEPESARLAVLYYLDELTEDELGKELGLSPRAIGKRLRKLIAGARALLHQETLS